MTGLGGHGLTSPHDAEPALRVGVIPVDEPVLCVTCRRPVWKDEAGAWEHAEAGDLRGKPVGPVVTEEELRRMHPCGRPLPHGPHRVEITERDLIGGYRCEGVR